MHGRTKPVAAVLTGPDGTPNCLAGLLGSTSGDQLMVSYSTMGVASPWRVVPTPSEDVALDDFTVFQSCVNGAEQPPACYN